MRTLTSNETAATRSAQPATGLLALSDSQFRAIRDLTYRVAGINLPEGKEGLVQSRLSRRIRQLQLSGFAAYIELLRSDRAGRETSHMIDMLTTNKTSFFREPRHFDFLSSDVLPPRLEAGEPVRMWSAGCSSGEEPYSLSMLTLYLARDRRTDTRILATDIASDILEHARSGIYDERQVETVPEPFHRYLEKVEPAQPVRFRVRDAVRARVRFARLNLMREWPMRGPFDVIFCRNVMIYFDKATQNQLVGRFAALLRPGGYLFIGHSESLSGIRHGLRFVQPAVYVR